MPTLNLLVAAGLGVLVWSSACAPAPTSATPEHSAPSTPTRMPAVVEAPPAGTHAAAPTSSDARPSAQTMLALSASEEAWAGATNPARGLVVVDFYEDASGEDPRANPQGVVEFAQHLCGTQLAQEARQIFTDLHSRVEHRDPAYGPVFTCEDMSCIHQAEMEFDHQGEFVFVAGPRGPILDHVVRLEGGSATEAFRNVGTDFARAELKRLANARCE